MGSGNSYVSTGLGKGRLSGMGVDSFGTAENTPILCLKMWRSTLDWTGLHEGEIRR